MEESPQTDSLKIWRAYSSPAIDEEMKWIPASASATAGTRSARRRDLMTYPNAPSARQARTNSTRSCTVRKTNRAVDPASRSLWAASIQESSGIEMSAMMMSG
jgi:hypothetical protein